VRTLNESTICFLRLSFPRSSRGRKIGNYYDNDERFQLISTRNGFLSHHSRVLTLASDVEQIPYRYEYRVFTVASKAFRREDRFIVNYFIELLTRLLGSLRLFVSRIPKDWFLTCRLASLSRCVAVLRALGK
jgi:hypothetical protein